MSFEVLVQAPGPEWIGNTLRFATREEAHAYGVDLASRWFMVTAFRIVKSTDPVNYCLLERKRD
jgi:hypothetical protein